MTNNTLVQKSKKKTMVDTKPNEVNELEIGSTIAHIHFSQKIKLTNKLNQIKHVG
jgi:hypothetical protein